ncbi:hypothetical protein OAU50_03315 [Planctomycetota bacterium]|nr:hypothetical protein [Planctomycetota bacterium]
MADSEVLFTATVLPYQQFDDDHTPSHLDTPPVSALRIIKFTDEEYYLESISAGGDLVGDSRHESIEQAMNDALEYYHVQMSDWKSHS